MKKIVKKGILFLYPWRDALGIIFAGIPFRIGEIWTLFISFNYITDKKSRLKIKDSSIVIILLLNLILSFIGVLIFSKTIDHSFAMKYLFRNIIYLITMYTFLCSTIEFTKDDIDRLMYYTVILQLVFFVIFYISGYYMYMGQIVQKMKVYEQGQIVRIGEILIMRFRGTASEPGYLAPLLPVTLYYFIDSLFKAGGNKKKIVICIISIAVMTLFTFSSAVYMIQAITTIVALLRNGANGRALLLMIIIFGIVTLIAAIVLIPEISDYVRTELIDKLRVYLGMNSSSWSYSAADRSEHTQNALKMFDEGNIFETFFGHGTGAYLVYSRESTAMVKEVEEAYNIYLSTLTDRGVLGFCLIVGLFFSIRKYRIRKDMVSETIYWGVLCQFIHWMLTGNLWQYSFFFNVMILIGYRRYINNRRAILE